MYPRVSEKDLSSRDDDSYAERVPDGTFRDVVISDRDVCDNCFRRTHERYEKNYAVDAKHGEIWIRALEDVGDELYRILDSSTRMPWRGSHRGMRTICACGYPTGTRSRPLSKVEFLERVPRLVARLVESGISFSESELSKFVENAAKMKADPDMQFADDRLYHRLTEQHVSERIRSET